MSNNRAKALLSVRLWLDCPSCDEQLDLMNIDELNGEGEMWDLINNRDEWKDPGYIFDCPKCDKHLVLKELEY